MTISGISAWTTQDATTTTNSTATQQTDQNSATGKAHHHRHGGAPPDPSQIAQKLFEKADTNGDGKVTKDELTAALPKRDGQQSSSAIDDLFKNADTDGDGTISQADLQTALQKQFQQHFASYDQSGSATTGSAASTPQTIGIA